MTLVIPAKVVPGAISRTRNLWSASPPSKTKSTAPGKISGDDRSGIANLGFLSATVALPTLIHVFQPSIGVPAAMWMIPGVCILGNVAAMTLVIPTQDQPHCGWSWLRNLLLV